MGDLALGGHSLYMDTMAIPIVRCPEIVSVSGVSGYGSMGDDNDDNVFKSEFAKQLEQSMSRTQTPVPPTIPAMDSTSDNMARYSSMYKQNEELRRAREEFMRIKQENLRLKYEIEKQKLEEERYQKLQYEVEHLTSRLHKMEENRQAYEDLTEQLGSYISLFTSQASLGHLQDVTRSYSTLQHVSSSSGRHEYGASDTCTLPKTRHGHYLDTSLDTSDGDQSQYRGFLSLPRHHQLRSRSRHHDRFRNRSRTIASNNARTMKKELTASVLDEEDDTKTLEISSAHDIGKKKSSFGIFLTKVKIYLLKRKKYDVQTLV